MNVRAQAGLDYRNSADMEKLAALVERYGSDPALAAEIFASGMMRPQWWVRVLMRFMIWRTGKTPLACWQMMVARLPELASVIPALADHIRHGKDRYDTASVGGLCGEEVILLLRFLSDAKRRRTP